MAINMPHEGGLELLSTMFGNKSKEASFAIEMYTTNSAFSDDDSNEVADLIDLESVPQVLNNLTGNLAGQGTLEQKILVVNGVPQVEFPEFIADFAGPMPGGESLFGYAVRSSAGRNVIFREKFAEPFVPGAGKILRFIPTLKVGNTTAPLT